MLTMDFFTDFAVLFYSIVIEKTQNGTASSKVLNWFDWDSSDSVNNYNWCRLCRLRLCQLKAECTDIPSFKGPHLLLLISFSLLCSALKKLKVHFHFIKYFSFMFLDFRSALIQLLECT